MNVYIVIDMVATAVLIAALKTVLVLKNDVIKPTINASVMENTVSSCHLSGDDLLALSEKLRIAMVTVDIPSDRYGTTIPFEKTQGAILGYLAKANIESAVRNN